MIDPRTEPLITLAQAARQVPPVGVSVGTLVRWSLRGVRGLRLDTVLRDGKWLTSSQALHRFFQSLNSGHR
jgi:hypothetical protein